MDTDPPARPRIDPAGLRQVLGHVPTAVTVVTATTPEGPAGLVVGSFVSISLEPPLIGIFVDQHSGSGAAVRAAGGFTVNVLAGDQQELCARFARRGRHGKFDGLVWRTSPQGHPLLPGAVAWIDCVTRKVQKLGDHFMAVGQVSDLCLESDTAPLIAHRRSLCTVSGRPATVP
jgi:3-hydroxy-9,10-secoandrosta-1,3,5(10)-triene-9,17-dione monooxygenase reductase component